ncbi:hypothetical protein [Nannocystis radixulma]|uniref:Peptidase MA-like domain-containing protein n=1 Tax=Nannocystis radixulma TaxID=2995305 RepID=A0ABT5B0K1_9BACT|nr:hypothetical protein [Nannocystis radixulma]MDC0667629.1 hypothetical protein [Nannocystis radixulma]
MRTQIKNKVRWPSAVLLVTALACEQEQSRLPTPDVVATSRYIEYSTWADPTLLCMDSQLAAADLFVEKTAAFLHSDPPPVSSIRYIHVPESLQDPARTWPCPSSIGACFLREGRVLDDRSAIYSPRPMHWHELVHAVAHHAIGRGGHWVIREGLADYLSQAGSTGAILEDFPQALKDDLEREEPSSDYRMATHFVGSVIERYGIARFKQFVARLDSDDRWEGVSSAYALEFGQDLEAALAEMALAPITLKGLFECEGEAIPWTSDGELDVTLTGTCGDPFYVSPGVAEETPGAFKTYVFDVSESAMYEFSLTSSNPGTVYGMLQNCDFRASWWVALDEARSVPLEPGKHVLSVGFPYGDDMLGELDFRLSRLAP